jgi:DNA-binding SARP family transcriptional activator
LRLFLLGVLDIRHDGQRVSKPPTPKSQSLFAYLALHRQQPQHRERLADLFWGDRPEHRVRRSLTTALWHIRRCLPHEDWLLSDVHSAQFDSQADLCLDVAGPSPWLPTKGPKSTGNNLGQLSDIPIG